MRISTYTVANIGIVAVRLHGVILRIAAVGLGIIEIRWILTPLSRRSDVVGCDRGNGNVAKELGIVGDGSTVDTASGRRRRGGRLGGGVGLGRGRGRSAKGVEVAESLDGGGGGSEKEGGALHVWI